MVQITVVLGDIVKQKVDAIVNAANSSLLGGMGVDGAIHKAAGQELLEECRRLGGCATGQAKITKAYLLPAKFVVHTVGPVFGKAKGKEALLLSSCYKNSLALAKKHGVKTIAFPAISTGAFHYPKEAAAKIAVETVKKTIAKDSFFEEIRFVLFNKKNLEIYKKASAAIAKKTGR